MTEEELRKALDKANMLLSSGDFQKAYNAYKKITKEVTDSSEAAFGLAESSVGIPKLTVQEIAAYYQRACDLDPTNPIFFATYGNFCFENGILKKGEECFLKAVELDEENSSVYLFDLANGYFHSAKDFANHYPDIKEEDILKTSLKYILMAFDITPEKAKDLISKI